MEYLRQVDFAAFAAAGAQERLTQGLLDRESGGKECTINCVRVPPGGGSPAGRHTHVFEQIYYIVSGTMDLEIGGQQFKAGPGTLVYLPVGVPHRNWNGGTEQVVHLAMMVPSPAPGQPIAIPAPD